MNTNYKIKEIILLNYYYNYFSIMAMPCESLRKIYDEVGTAK